MSKKPTDPFMQFSSGVSPTPSTEASNPEPEAPAKGKGTDEAKVDPAPGIMKERKDKEPRPARSAKTQAKPADSRYTVYLSSDIDREINDEYDDLNPRLRKAGLRRITFSPFLALLLQLGLETYTSDRKAIFDKIRNADKGGPDE